ncbi:MAG: protein translocase subunit SecF [Candidatus Colwellbacteria bacterium]|nr:protein translocase subunit SecF [Candidatus Colwellbacteria bacterium]
MEKILKYKKILLGVSILLILASAACLLSFGLEPGIDFTSGSFWQIYATGVSADDLRQFLGRDLELGDINIMSDEGTNIFSVTLRELSENERVDILSKLKAKFGETVAEQDFSSISPAVSKELTHKAWWAIGLVLLGISLYVAFAFRKVSQPVSSWKYGLLTLLSLVHDVIIPAGLFAILGAYHGVTVDINFMVALLVVMGFSVHDTIVVFDRIRENLTKWGAKMDFEELIDKSIVQTIVRSINTSLALILVLISIYIWGPINLKYFILAILVGSVAGVYSSMFVAAPALLFVSRKKRRSG